MVRKWQGGTRATRESCKAAQINLRNVFDLVNDSSGSRYGRSRCGLVALLVVLLSSLLGHDVWWWASTSAQRWREVEMEVDLKADC